MDSLENLLDAVGVNSTECALCSALLENLVVAVCLENGHAMLLLVLSDFAADAHALCKEVHEIVVNLVNLLAESSNVLGCYNLVAYYEDR